FRIPRAPPREWVLRCIWKWRDERALVVAYSSVDSVDFPVNPSWTRATNVVCNVYEKLPEGAQGTTKATWTQQMDMKTRLPKWFAKRAGPAQNEYLSKMRKQFDRSSDIDARSRLKIIEAAEKAQTYTPEEVEQLKIGASRMSLFDEGDGKELKMSSGSKGKVKWKPGDSHAVGFATTTVRASAEQVTAFIWDTEARAKARHDDLEKAVDERPSEHNMLVYNRKKTPNAALRHEYDAEDGVAIGNLLLSETREEKHHEKGETRVEARVRALFVKNKGLKELGEKHRSLSALLAIVAANKLRPGGDSKAKLCNMTEKEARVIGGALASCIAANLTSQAAVDEWILRYPAM
ncbi:hypothetical protein TeGR_g5642, partial [Tetraparma gracilis]